MEILLDSDKISIITFDSLQNAKRGIVKINLSDSEYTELVNTWNKFFEFQEKLKELAKNKGFKF